MLNRVILCGSRHAIIRSMVRQSHGGGVPEKYQKFRPATMNEFPVPEGDWKEAYDKLQSKYNKQLVLGVVGFALTLTYIYTSDVIDFVFPPPMKNE